MGGLWTGSGRFKIARYCLYWQYSMLPQKKLVPCCPFHSTIFSKLTILSSIFLRHLFCQPINMKIILYAAILCGLFVSCNAQEGSSESGTSKEEKKVSKRDRSITKANSYSDLFVDSLTVEKFITDKK